MRPPELDVTLVLHKLHCVATEDAGSDEPYMWVLGFKVDADTIGPPGPGLEFNLGVDVFTGAPHFRHVLPHGQEADAGRAYQIPAALGTRSFRLRPALLPLGGWFPGLAGVVCLLWDEDGFAPATAEAGYDKLKALFGPALATELTRLFNGGYDDELSKDAGGGAVPDPPAGRTPEWRFSRLGDPVVRKNTVKAITKKVKEEIINRVKDAITDEAGVDEELDPDDLLGVDAQVFLGEELATNQVFSLSFTDDEADYKVEGLAYGSRVRLARLESAVTKVEPTVDRDVGLWRQVCWFGLKLYWAHAFRVRTTTRFELRTQVGESPAAVRWLLDDKLLADGQGSVPVTFEPVDQYEGPPQDALASFYLGGPGTLMYNAVGPILDVWNTAGDGVFFGNVRALYSYPGDPSLFPPSTTPVNDLLKLGYDQQAELGVVAVDLDMGDEYKADIKRCKRVTDEIDRKHIAVNFGKVKINPGDPPPFKQQLLDRVTAAASLANAVGLDLEPQQIPARFQSRRDAR